MATYLKNIFMEMQVEVSLCYWMLIVAVVMAPICWLGTPNDFWYEMEAILIKKL